MRKLLTFFLLLPLFANAQQNYSPLLNQYLQSQTNVYEFSGAVLVAQKGKIIYKNAFGLANKEWNISNTVLTKFRIGSLTKQFTATAILQLAEAGKLNLGDKLSKYIPDFPKGDSVTLHMLLNHTSGIKSYTNMANFSSVETLPFTKDSVIGFFKKEPYEFSPGTKYRYNNSGYFLLGYIIEKVSGQTYNNYILSNLIKKAGLNNTSVNQLDSILIGRAEGYRKAEAGWKHAEYISMEFPYSAGAIVSTIEDLYQWNKALFGGKIISSTMMDKMTTPYLNKYGYGLRIDSFQNHKRIGHSGGIPGFVSYNVYYPTEDIQIVVLSNNSSNSSAIAEALAAILFDNEVIAPYKHVEIKMDSKDLTKYVGKYEFNGSLIELVIKNDKLYRRVNLTDIELKPESIHKFFFADGSDRQLEFIVDKNNTITTAKLISYGVPSVLKILPK